MADALGEALERLWRVIESRRGADPATSYTAKLFARGTAKIAQKLGEEAVEAVIEGVKGDRVALVGESADVLYHLWCCGPRAASPRRMSPPNSRAAKAPPASPRRRAGNPRRMG